MNFKSTQLYTSKELDVKISTQLDFPIINEDNAIVAEIRDDDYSNQFNIPNIYSGLIKHENNYYFFDHSIVDKLNNYSKSPCHSYSIHQITSNLAERIIRGENFNIWEIKFESLYHFGHYFISLKSGSYCTSYKYSSKLENNKLTIPYRTSPSDLIQGQTIGEYLEKHYGIYGNSKGKVLELNKSNYRSQLLEEVLC